MAPLETRVARKNVVERLASYQRRCYGEGMPTNLETPFNIIDEQTRYQDNPREAFFCRVAQEWNCPECGGRLDTDGEGVWCTTSDCDGPEDE